MPSPWGMKSPTKSEVSLGGVQAAFTWTPLGRARATLKNFELTVEPGERVLLLGRSGSGKSTVLHALLGALGSTLSGTLEGSVVSNGRIGFVPQNPSDGLVAERIGRDVAFGPENLGLDREEIWRRVGAALNAVRLTYPLEHPAHALSGGEQQRLALAGVLAMEPDIMLFDEPTAMLDPLTATHAREAIMAAVGDRTMIVVEHRFEPWLAHVDRVVVLDGGQIISDTSPAELPQLPGLWHPGMAVPQPSALSPELLTPVGAVSDVSVEDIAVDVTSRTLRGSQKIRALSGVSCRFLCGQTTAVTGPSGSGKSTLLLAASGLLRPASGHVTPDRSSVRSDELSAGLGWVPQNPEHGFLTTSVRTEIEATSKSLGRTVDVEQVLAAVGLEQYAESHPYRLSGGEQRRLALASALAHRPGFIVLDEPSVGQDPESWALVAGWMKGAAATGATVVVGTHDSDLPHDHRVALAGRS